MDIAQPNKASLADELLKLHGELTEGSLTKAWEPTKDPDANELLNGDPLAFLLGVIADYGIPAERAWILPSRLREKLGHLDPQRIAEMSEASLTEVLRSIPRGHRFPRMVARSYIEACKRVVQQYAGDAGKIWENCSLKQALANLYTLRGTGQKKASMAVNILARDLGWIKPRNNELSSIDVSYDVHVRRVFLRSCLVDQDKLEEVLGAAKALSPTYPGKLDIGAWYVGRTWCHPQKPDCRNCRLNSVYPKMVERNVSGV